MATAAVTIKTEEEEEDMMVEDSWWICGNGRGNVAGLCCRGREEEGGVRGVLLRLVPCTGVWGYAGRDVLAGGGEGG